MLRHRAEVSKRGPGLVVAMADESGARVVAYGKVLRGSEEPVTGDTVFEVGSVTKVFTSLLLAQMVEAGEARLDDAIASRVRRQAAQAYAAGAALAAKTREDAQVGDGLAPRRLSAHIPEEEEAASPECPPRACGAAMPDNHLHGGRAEPDLAGALDGREAGAALLLEAGAETHLRHVAGAREAALRGQHLAVLGRRECLAVAVCGRRRRLREARCASSIRSRCRSIPRPPATATRSVRAARPPPDPSPGQARGFRLRFRSTGGPMDFGIFVEQMRRGVNQTDAFREMFDLVDVAERWGLDIVWLAEMLFNPARSVLSGPLLVASWIAARTRRLRTGTAVQLLPTAEYVGESARRGFIRLEDAVQFSLQPVSLLKLLIPTSPAFLAGETPDLGRLVRGGVVRPARGEASKSVLATKPPSTRKGVSAVRALVASGDAFLAAVVTRGTDVARVARRVIHLKDGRIRD